MGIDYNRGSLIFVVLAFQLHVIAMAITGESFNQLTCDDGSQGNNCGLNVAVTAFLIIAYLMFLVTFILNMIMNFMGDLKGNFGVNIACIVMCLFAALCVMLGIIIFAVGNSDNNNAGGTSKQLACAMTTFFTSGSCGIIAAVFLILVICGK